MAGITSSASFTSNLSNGGNAAYGGTAPTGTLSSTVGSLVSMIFGVLGVVFLLLIIYAGVLWMTAQGDSKKVQKAKDILTQSAIGLAITLSAFAISYFVFVRIGLATGVLNPM
jgi:uncharacterized BrkB/YihY/UPF0761 family membrane protein